MSITTESSSSTTNKLIRTNLIENIDDMTPLVDNHNQTLVIILTVTLPTLLCIILFTIFVLCYRRRHTTICLKKLENSNRLRDIIINLSPSSIQPKYCEKIFCHSYPQYQPQRTKTIIYNRLNRPSISKVYNQLKTPIHGETNAAFDEQSFKNEEQPILKSSSISTPPPSTLQTEFPVFVQTPVPTITTEFVKTIAAHRLNTLPDTNSLQSETSSCDSSSSQTILLFSQRTEF